MLKEKPKIHSSGWLYQWRIYLCFYRWRQTRSSMLCWLSSTRTRAGTWRTTFANSVIDPKSTRQTQGLLSPMSCTVGSCHLIVTYPKSYDIWTPLIRQNLFLTAINGYVFESGPHLGFCNGEIATWHMSSIGAQDYIQTATFYGHTFEVNGRTEDFLSLYPMTGETITMEMDNIGK